MSVKYECIVCGKKFPKGQGVLLNLYNVELAFHSKSCALKFFKTLFSKIEYGLIGNYVEATINEFREKIADDRKRKAKNI